MGDNNNYSEDYFDSAADAGVSEGEGRALCEQAKDLARNIRIAEMEFDVCTNELSGLEIDSKEWDECIEKMKDYNKQIYENIKLAGDSVVYLESLRTEGLDDGC